MHNCICSEMAFLILLQYMKLPLACIVCISATYICRLQSFPFPPCLGVASWFLHFCLILSIAASTVTVRSLFTYYIYHRYKYIALAHMFQRHSYILHTLPCRHVPTAFGATLSIAAVLHICGLSWKHCLIFSATFITWKQIQTFCF